MTSTQVTDVIKYVHTTRHESIAYYYSKKCHYDMAMAALDKFPSGTIQLMAMADFAVDRITNQLVKNRSACLETFLDAHLNPEIAN